MLLMSASREHLRREVWNKAQTIPGADPAVWRKDAAGWVICYSDYANHLSAFCWVMHHQVPRSRGGGDSPFNLTPQNASRSRESQDPRPWAHKRR